MPVSGARKVSPCPGRARSEDHAALPPPLGCPPAIPGGVNIANRFRQPSPSAAVHQRGNLPPSPSVSASGSDVSRRSSNCPDSTRRRDLSARPAPMVSSQPAQAQGDALIPPPRISPHAAEASLASGGRPPFSFCRPPTLSAAAKAKAAARALSSPAEARSPLCADKAQVMSTQYPLAPVVIPTMRASSQDQPRTAYDSDDTLHGSPVPSHLHGNTATSACGYGSDCVEATSQPFVPNPAPRAAAFDSGHLADLVASLPRLPSLPASASPGIPLDSPPSPSSSSSSRGMQCGESDRVSWGSASAWPQNRSPPLSPLGMAQRHMRNRKPLGLRNLGNTCFLNAALQALAHTPLLAPFFLQGHFVRDLNAANPLGTGGVLATAFAELLQRLYPVENEGKGTRCSDRNFLIPEEFYSALCRMCPLVGEQRGAQQDAHEVLAFLLDALHEDLNRATKKPAYKERKDLAEEDLSRKGEERYAAEAWHDHLRRHRSVLVDLCQGQLRSQVRCCECGCCSVTFDPFLFLSLPMPRTMKRGEKQPIEAAIRAFCAEEKLDGDDRWGCPRCARRVSALKRLSLWKLPLLLLVHLKRFGFEASPSWDVAPKAWKIEGEISVPFSRLDLQGFVADTSPQRVPLQYDLFAAVDHVGATPLVGHYTASCRRADGWWRFDDSQVHFLGTTGEEAAGGAGVLGEENYLLLFQRRDAPPEPELVRQQSHQMPENWPHVKGDGIEWSFLPDTEASQQL